MSNVLPTEHKKKETGRLWTRFLLVGAVMLAGGAVVATLAILPAFISVRIARAGIETSEAARLASGDQSAAARAQVLLGILGSIAAATSSPSGVLAGALSLKPANISVNTIIYTGGGQGKIVLSGVAGRREAVSEYRDALSGSGRFVDVAVPVAALVGTQEGKFTITLSGSF